MSDEYVALREMANERINDILELLDVPFKERYHSLVGACPVHLGDNKNAFSWHIDRGIWKCWSRGCDSQYGSTIFGLVAGIKQITFSEAIRWIREFIGEAITPEKIKLLKDRKANRAFIFDFRKRQESQITFSWESLNKLMPHDYLVTDRGFPAELVERYHIGACFTPGKFMWGRIVIPVINAANEIVGFSGRTLDPDWKAKGIPKWLHSRNGDWMCHNVFNANFAAPFIQESETAIVCEGALDVLRLEHAGIHNGVAIMGRQLYNGQMTSLMNMGATKIILALDNDKAGRLGRVQAAKMARCLFSVSELKIPEEYKDIGDMPPELLKEVVNATK